MNYKHTLSYLLVISSMASCSPTIDDFKRIEWLVGRWDRINKKEGRAAHERWAKVSDTELRGWGIAMQGEDTAFVEKLNIVLQDCTLFYVADVPENPKPVFFKFTSISKNGFVGENPDHDFPKKIQYEFKSDTLIAITSGDGKELRFEFVKTISK